MENQDIKLGITIAEIDEIISSSTTSNSEDILNLIKNKGGVKNFEKVLKTNFKNGIEGSEKDIAHRIRNFGDNYDLNSPEKGFCYFVCEVLGDTFLRILILCAIFQISVGASPLSENPDKDWIDGLGIVFAIIIIVLTASITNYKKEKEFRNLSEINNSNSVVTVLRNKNQINMNYSALLVGDIVKLTQGMVIPADGILYECDDLKIDESSLTGESNMIKKNTYENCLKILGKKNNKNLENNVNSNNGNKNIIINNDLYSLNNLDRFNRSINNTNNASQVNSTTSMNNINYNNTKNNLENSKLEKVVKIPIPIVFSGTLVNSGYGTMLVLAVGKNSTKGKLQQVIMNEGDKEESKTPLECKLEDVAEDIGKFGMYAAVFTFLALLSKYLFSKYNEYEFHLKTLQDHIFNSSNNQNYTQEILADIKKNNKNLSELYSHDNIFLGNKNQSEIIQNSSNFFNSTTFNISNSDHLVNPYKIFEGAYKEIFTILVLCITIIVVAIPEGLPLAVTLALSFSVSKMMKVNNLVRNMSACEVVGGANYICTDKTGTLTKNQLELTGFILHDYVFEKRNNNLNKNLTGIKSQIGEGNFDLILNSILGNMSIVLNNENKISYGLELDKSIFEFFSENYDDTMKIYENNKNSTFDRINFNSIRKKMTTIVNIQNRGEPKKYRVFIKGASEYILESCSNFLNYKKNSSENLTDSVKKMIYLNIEKCASMSYRLIGFAYKDVFEGEISHFRDGDIEVESETYAFEKNNFCFLGLLSFKDGIRPGVSEAVLKCSKAGIKVIMITGDTPTSAIAIAQECNIIQESDFSFNEKEKICMTGAEFYQRIGGLFCDTCLNNIESCKCPISAEEARLAGLSEEHIRKDRIRSLESFKKIVKDFSVFARTRPLDKYCLVKGLKELDNVVAVTGDGTNDAMALRKSDVGFAMGINGTDIAKNASDIILLDDNFASIINAVLWGRGIFDNIRKFIQFQLSVNISAVMLVFFSSCIGSESPISAIQMLWLNMIMDSLGSLCLATEEPREKLLNRKPYSKREYIINPLMWKHILFQALFQFTIVFLLYLYAPHFIKENDPERIFLGDQLENCFGNIPGIKVTFSNHKLIHYIIDGKKSMWDPLNVMKRNLDKEFCFFYDYSKFEKGKIKNLYNAYKWIISEYGNTVHMTIIFNTFVIYALFNQLNSRILDDSFNVFENLHQNCLFVLIIFCEILIQFSIVQYGGLIFNCVKGGLTSDQWIICLVIGSLSLVVSCLLKCTNLQKYFDTKFWERYGFFKRKDNRDESSQLVEMVNDNYEDDI